MTAAPATAPLSPSIHRLATFKDPFPTTPTPTATATATPSISPLDAIAADPILAPFLSPDFSATRFSSSALSAGSAAARAERLQDAVALLHSQIRAEVLARHPHLLSHLSSLSDATSALHLLRSSLSSLRSSVHRLRLDLSEPHRRLRALSLQLSNLHHTSALLHDAARLLRLSAKLRDLESHHSDAKFDLAKAAQLHREISLIAAEHGLAGITAVDEELAWLGGVGERIRSEGMKVLEKGLDELNQPEVGSGLQVCYNLGELKECVEGLVVKYKGLAIKSVGLALDLKLVSAAVSGSGLTAGPGSVHRSGTPQIGGGARAKELLWQRLGACMDQIHSIVVAVWHLQRMLSKKRDPFTHVLFLEEVLQEGDPLLTERVWEALVKAFASQLKSVFTASSFMKETFTVGYPKLYAMMENLVERISRDTDVKGVPLAVSIRGKDQMFAVVDIFKTAFLALCLSRLSDLVNNVFPVASRGNSIPSKEQISKICSRIQEEIEAVKLDGRLTFLVSREIGKVLLLLSQRAEYQISTGSEAKQVTGPATSSQIRNFTLCQHLQEVHARVSSIFLELPSVASEALSLSLGSIHGVARDSVTSLFHAMQDRLEGCILQIHEQNFRIESMDAAGDNSPSKYMEEVQNCVTHFRAEFLSRLLPSSLTHTASTSAESICIGLVRGMASRVLSFFIRHASLVRPLSESGKLRMARDMAELELAVGQSLFPVEQLGFPYRTLRAFRPLIFLEISQLERSPLLQDLPPSVVLHHLYSRGPEELQSPLQRNKLTPLQYSLWLDSQGEDQVWKGIKATLDDYAAKVKARGEKEFSPVYPLMLRLGMSMIKHGTSIKS